MNTDVVSNDRWYVKRGDNIVGPLSTSVLHERLEQGHIRPSDAVSNNRRHWRRVSEQFALPTGVQSAQTSGVHSGDRAAVAVPQSALTITVTGDHEHVVPLMREYGDRIAVAAREIPAMARGGASITCHVRRVTKGDRAVRWLTTNLVGRPTIIVDLTITRSGQTLLEMSLHASVAMLRLSDGGAFHPLGRTDRSFNKGNCRRIAKLLVDVLSRSHALQREQRSLLLRAVGLRTSRRSSLDHYTGGPLGRATFGQVIVHATLVCLLNGHVASLILIVPFADVPIYEPAYMGILVWLKLALIAAGALLPIAYILALFGFVSRPR